MVFEEIKKTIYRDILEKLPPYLTYHNLAHTEYVMSKAIFLASEAGISKTDLSLLKLAALFHDTGFIINPKDHEIRGCGIAREYLGKNLNDEEMKKICGMIMATKIPQSPTNQLEQILADADLEYLGTDQFEIQGNALLKELRHFNPDLSDQAWNEVQLTFMEKHQFHTDYCKKFREPIKQKHIQSVREKLSIPK